MIQESLARLADLEAPDNPFPGLRPFEFDESHLFFGRDGQSEQLIEKLGQNRFLAIVGTSGSGKSSLVRAGLLPALFGGMMPSAGSAWHVALLRPGNDPVGNLAQALCSADAFGSDDADNRQLQVAITEATLRRGRLGLVEAVRQSNMPVTENLLVIADQFEELFRIEADARDDALENNKAAFVKLLLAAAAQPELPIYVALTMRSDYLGDCAQFQDLPEAINESQYLVPRMTRDQRREAVAGPVAVGGAEITPRLVNRLLNDVGDDPGQLPILQHALMRTWEEWRAKQFEVGGRRHAEVHNGVAIDLCCYEAVGGMARALSLHADEAFAELNERQRKIAEKMFKRLTEKGADNREGRRPASVAELCAVAEADEIDVVAIIEIFRRRQRSFLTASTSPKGNAESLVDISHESLIRGWQRLNVWVNEEAQSARIYRRLAETAVLNNKGEARLWGDPDLQLALNWREQQQPNRVWARRYHRNFHLAMHFLEKSSAIREEEARERERQRASKLRRLYFTATILGVAFILTLIALFYALRQRQVAEERQVTIRGLYYNSSINLARDAFARGDTGWGRRLLADFLVDLDGLRGFEWYHFWLRYPRELATLKGHGRQVLAVAFSPDGKRLAIGDYSGNVKLWDVVNATESVAVKAHKAAVFSAVFSPDGKRLASGGTDGIVKLWEIGNPDSVAIARPHGSEVRAVAFSLDGKRLLSGGTDGTVKVWDAGNGQELAKYKVDEGAVSAVAVSVDGKWLATGSENGWAKLWNLGSSTEVARLDGKGNRILTVTFSSDSKRLAVGSEDGTVWLCETGAELNPKILRWLRTPIRALAFSLDGLRLATGGGDGAVRLWEANSGQELATLQGFTDQVRAVTFSPNGKLAGGSADGIVKLWEISESNEIATLKGHQLPVKSLAYFPDGKRLASASEDGTIKLWKVADVIEQPMTVTISGGTVRAVAVSPDGKKLASAGAGGVVRLWDALTGRELAALRGHGNYVSTVAFSHDGKWLASGGEDGKVILWDTRNRQPQATLKDLGMPVWSVAFSPDGQRLAAGIADGTINLWAVNSGEESARLKGHTDQVRTLAFSPDGKRLASGSDDLMAKLWDVSSGREVATLRGHVAPVSSVAFSHDSRRLASAGKDGRVKLWKTLDGQEIVTLKSEGSPVWAVAFSPDGKSLASGGEDQNVRLWFAATIEEVARQRNQ